MPETPQDASILDQPSLSVEQRVLKAKYSSPPRYSQMNSGDIFGLEAPLVRKSNYYFEWSARMDVRNGGGLRPERKLEAIQRSVLSRSKAVSGVLGLPYLPEVTVRDIACERMPDFLLKADNLIANGQAGSRREALAILAEDIKLPLDKEQLHREEFASVTTRRVAHYLEKHEYDKALAICEEKINSDSVMTEALQKGIAKVFAGAIQDLITADFRLNHIRGLAKSNRTAQIKRRRASLSFAQIFLNRDREHLARLYLDFVRPFGIRQEDVGLDDDVLSHDALWHVLERYVNWR